MPDSFWTGMVLAAAHGQLGDLVAARSALKDLLAQQEDFAQSGRQLMGKWFEPQLVEHFTDGLRKAGLGVGAAVLGPGSSGGKQAPVSIAVLPFADMSPAKDQQYLCEGMAEEVMNALVRIQGIRVASRTSAFRASREEKDLAAIGRVLSVEQVLEGSVRTAGSQLRVTAQLSDVATGCQLWSERFDRGSEDVFAVQDEIARGVVEAVKARLSSGKHAVPARPHAGNLEAYRSYSKGRFLRHTKNDHGGALSAFEEAVRLDPSHGPALGETDAAFEVLARAEDERQAFIDSTGFPGFDPLRNDPRFDAFVARIGGGSATRSGQ